MHLTKAGDALALAIPLRIGAPLALRHVVRAFTMPNEMHELCSTRNVLWHTGDLRAANGDATHGSEYIIGTCAQSCDVIVHLTLLMRFYCRLARCNMLAARTLNVWRTLLVSAVYQQITEHLDRIVRAWVHSDQLRNRLLHGHAHLVL